MALPGLKIGEGRHVIEIVALTHLCISPKTQVFERCAKCKHSPCLEILFTMLQIGSANLVGGAVPPVYSPIGEYLAKPLRLYRLGINGHEF
jgi:hypothetical protein